MILRQLGSSELRVSAVGIGTWAMGGDFFGEVEENNAIGAIHAGLDFGINLIDTAPAYGRDGRSESIVGKALAGRRDKVVLCTKVGVLRRGAEFVRCLAPDTLRGQLEDSLKRLNTDVIDLYQIHWPDANTPLDDTLEVLTKLRAEGKFRYLGVSNFGPELMRQAIDGAGIVSCQPPYSMLDRKAEREILPFCIENGLGTLTYGSLSGGLLTGRYTQPPTPSETDRRSNFYPFFKEPGWTQSQQLISAVRDIARAHGYTVAQTVIAWTVAQPGVTCALVGASKPSQAVDNAKSLDIALSPAEIAAIREACERYII